MFATASIAQENVKLGVYPSAPFIMDNPLAITGFDAELWEHIANSNNWDSEIVIVNSFSELINGIEQGKFDAAISNITINADREQRVDFSHPYMESGLGIMIPSNQVEGLLFKFWRNIAMYSPIIPFIGGVLVVYLLFCYCVGFVLWALDRGSKDSGIPDNFSEGYLEAVWLAHATGSTVGYGDVAPKRLMARLASIAVFFGGAILISVITAKITSFQVVEHFKSSINGPEDLRNKTVGVVSGTTSAASVQSYGANAVQYSSAEEGYEALENGEIEAFVYDHPRLKYYSLNEGAGKVQLVGGIFDEQSYGIAFREGSNLRESANISLLSFQDGNVHKQLVAKYFGSND